MIDIIVVGGGPAGMLSAIFSARRGFRVTLLEKNEKLGKKLYITGKGRCNVTNASDVEHHLTQTMTNPKFMYSALYTFDSQQTIDFFESLGCPMKIERGQRVFPESDKSSDIILVLAQELKRLGVDVRFNTEVLQITKNDTIFSVKTGKEVFTSQYVIVATGGISYPMTGSTGDGYKFAEAFGHKIIAPTQALVPLNVQFPWIKELQGLSLKNIALSLFVNKKMVYSEIGEMLFTHFGISGPLVLSASSYIGKECEEKKAVVAVLDLKPGLSYEKLDQRLMKDFQKYSNKHFINALDDLLPQKMIKIIVENAGIEPHKPVHQLSKEERQQLMKQIKELQLPIASKRSVNEAVITQGGISVKEIDPGTMASKRVQGLFFVGEVIDVDALTGGYNLQIAYSTAVLAALSINKED